MDELIDRARRDEATADELAQLDAWRRASVSNDRHYRDTIRLLEAGRSLGVAPGAERPGSSEIIARAATLDRFDGRSRLTRWAPWAIAAAAAIIAVLALRSRSSADVSPIPGWGATEVVTGATELATVQLGEGSVVRLAPSSRLRVLAGRQRVVSLEGRAFFVVQRMPQYPLHIQTRAGEARVLGTRFELATDDDGLQLRVVEGRVALSTKRDQIEVGAGEETVVSNGTATPPTPVTTTAPVAPWVGTFLAFQATPVRDVAREIERVYKITVAIGDSTLASETITATFTDRPVKEIVNVVCSVLNARCEVRADTIRIGR